MRNACSITDDAVALASASGPACPTSSSPRRGGEICKRCARPWRSGPVTSRSWPAVARRRAEGIVARRRRRPCSRGSNRRTAGYPIAASTRRRSRCRCLAAVVAQRRGTHPLAGSRPGELLPISSREGAARTAWRPRHQRQLVLRSLTWLHLEERGWPLLAPAVGAVLWQPAKPAAWAGGRSRSLELGACAYPAQPGSAVRRRVDGSGRGPRPPALTRSSPPCATFRSRWSGIRAMCRVRRLRCAPVWRRCRPGRRDRGWRWRICR